MAKLNNDFELSLDHGPYVHSYSRNGRQLLLGGKRGHLALFDWHRPKLLAELFVSDRINDVCTLFDDSTFAAAQSRGVFVYDRDGVQVHELKTGGAPSRICFLPHHFLLCSVGRTGRLGYADVSTGQRVASLRTRQGACRVMAANPWTGVVNLGHVDGTVSLWAPKNERALVKIAAHRGPVLDVCVDLSGRHMVTAGGDGIVNIFDLRKYEKISSYRCHVSRGNTVALSQKNTLAVCEGPRVRLWANAFGQKLGNPDKTKLFPGQKVNFARFCPFEDALGLSTEKGFVSLSVAGAGEADFDSFDVNPFESKREKQNRLVRALVEKIQPQFITLDPDDVGRVYERKGGFK